MTDQLRAAAQAVLDRWDSPKWEWAKQGPTADLMAELRAALAQQAEPGEHYASIPGTNVRVRLQTAHDSKAMEGEKE